MESQKGSFPLPQVTRLVMAGFEPGFCDSESAGLTAPGAAFQVFLQQSQVWKGVVGRR